MKTNGRKPSDLTELVNVGRSVSGYFGRIGITEIAQLVGRDPLDLYERMSAAFGERLDPCLLDTVMSAVDQAEGRPARPWWHYTPQRKQLLDQRGGVSPQREPAYGSDGRTRGRRVSG
ncbi:hypothetical protein GCM10020216_029910 [Nonomuraea helvata]